MASFAAEPPSTQPWSGQIDLGTAGRARAAIERWLEAERDQLALWLPVMLGAGVALWFALPDPVEWAGCGLALSGFGLAALAIGRGGRAMRVAAIAGLSAAVGLGLVWSRAERVSAPILGGPAIATFSGKIDRIEPLPARGLVRLTILVIGRGADSDGQPVPLPPKLRVNIQDGDMPAPLTEGATVRLRARLMPPPVPAVPGAYDYARVAWFDGIGATGRGFAPIVVLGPGAPEGGLRARLTAHITNRIPGSAGGIAAALATGDIGTISDEDSQAMRRAGLAHLLSVSGLHITAVVTATMLVVLRLLALSPWLALRFRLPLIAAAAGAAAAIGYTLLTGSAVPTIRSCVAALLVLAAFAMGREAITLRLVAAGATLVILVWPEAIAGPSFQLSFAAIAAIVSLHEHPRIKAWFLKREERWLRRAARELGSLLLTGLVVELALMPIAVFHFHKAGIYGAFANIVAIPLTTFMVMPLEALALAADLVGFGAPFWWLTANALGLLLAMAHAVSTAPGAVAALPAMPSIAYALMIAGGLWIALWRTRLRRWGTVPLVIGALWALATPAPDLLITGDGRHVAIRTASGELALLRDKAGDYTRDTLAENGGVDGEPLFLSDQPDARCSRDLCLAERQAGKRRWRILATRSAYLVPAAELIAACGTADIVISERRLPRGCKPRWLKLDRGTLHERGGMAITLATGHIETVLHPGDRHPWRDPPTLEPPLNRTGGGYPKAYPGRGPGRGHSAADHKRGWRDRAGPSRPRGGNI